jgi:undecaprenyl-diphosphatase
MKLAKLAAWDQRFFIRVFQRFASQQVCRAAFWLSKTADGPFYLLVAVVLYASQPAGYLSFIQLLALGFAIELPLYLLLKNAVKRLRPADLLANDIQSYIIPSDKFSLPSGHTAGAFVLTTTVAFNYPQYLPLVLPWALGVGLSRVLLGVHFPCDILAGMVLGVVSVCCAMFLFF